MVTRRTGPDPDSQTIGGFQDSIIAKRHPDEKARGPDHLANRTRIASWLESLPLTEPTRAKDAAFALLLALGVGVVRNPVLPTARLVIDEETRFIVFAAVLASAGLAWLARQALTG